MGPIEARSTRTTGGVFCFLRELCGLGVFCIDDVVAIWMNQFREIKNSIKDNLFSYASSSTLYPCHEVAGWVVVSN